MNWLLASWIVGIVGVFYLANSARAMMITRIERGAILDHIRQNIYDPNMKYAFKELDDVTWKEHKRKCFWFRNRMCLYGPIIQCLDQHGSLINFQEYTWKCYNLYTLLTHPMRRKINRILYTMARPWNLPYAMEIAGFEPPEYDKPPKLVMTDGAVEYDEIIAAQDLMNG